jgi:hypothetical protein
MALRPKERFAEYLRFKERLLTAMVTCDPLAILDSGVFEQYEAAVFAAEASATAMDTVIRQYTVEGVQLSVVERRSHSCESVANRESREQQKIRRLEEQSKVDLAIWSNIMWNHLRLREQQQSKGAQNDRSEDKENNFNCSNGAHQPQRMHCNGASEANSLSSV